MRQNIPAEIRALRQWVVSGPSKIPLNPRNGQVAYPSDPSTWGTFEEALATGAANIGIFLTKEDPYCVIDLDDKESNPASDAEKERHRQILSFFESYTELSISGRGYHVVLKGSVPFGVNRDNVEIYSDVRHIIFTGNVVKNLPIAEGYQPTLDAMYEQMKPEDRVELIEVDEVGDDNDVYEMAANAANAAKFNALCRGDIEEYHSQSEADLALLSILAYYTRSDEQVRRLFRMTALGQREKAVKNDRYINFALGKIRAKQPPPVDFTALIANMQRVVEAPIVDTTAMPPQDLPYVQPPAPAPEPQQAISNVTLPPGLVGEVAQFVYATSIRPVPEIALATAIAFVAGIAGRAYNTSTRAGLSQYIALLAKTGTGKEAAANAISILLMAIRPKIPAAMDFMGPSVFASGPAMHRILSAKPCFVSVLGEFGLLLQKLSNKNANTADVTLKKTLLDSYGKSGFGNMLQPSVYSDKEKDVAAIASPNITILGESTPESFYDSLDESAVKSGFLPRFFIIEYFGERPPRNENPYMPPSEGMLNRISELMVYALQAQANQTCMPVQNDLYAQKVLDEFDKECDSRMRGQGDTLTEIWNRSHLKALKLSSLIAVGVNPHQPIVTEGMAQWAVALIRDDSSRLSARFQSGDIGEGFQKQKSLVVDAIKWYFGTEHKTPKREAFRQAGFIERSAIHPRVAGQPAFKSDRDPLGAFNKVLLDMLANGELVQIDSRSLKERFNTTAMCYGVGDNWNPG